MANDSFIGVDVIGLKELQAKLAKLPKQARDAVVEDGADFLINLFKQYPPKKSVSRKQAYGQTFQSDKQRRWFFANLADGTLHIPYNRTQTMRNGWKKVGEGENIIVANEVPYAGFLMGDTGQARQPAMVGWQTMNITIDNHKDSFIKRLDAAIKRAIRKLGL